VQAKVQTNGNLTPSSELEVATLANLASRGKMFPRILELHLTFSQVGLNPLDLVSLFFSCDTVEVDEASFLSWQQWKILGEAKHENNFLLIVEKKQLEIVIGKDKKVLSDVKKIVSEDGNVLCYPSQTRLDQALVLTALRLLPSVSRMFLSNLSLHSELKEGFAHLVSRVSETVILEGMTFPPGFWNLLAEASALPDWKVKELWVYNMNIDDPTDCEHLGEVGSHTRMVDLVNVKLSSFERFSQSFFDGVKRGGRCEEVKFTGITTEENREGIDELGRKLKWEKRTDYGYVTLKNVETLK